MSAALQPTTEIAFREFLAHRTMLKVYIVAIVRDPELAEDTLGDVAVEIARSWSQFNPARGTFGAWSRGVARRLALANLRKHRSKNVLLDADVLDAVASEIDRLGDEAMLEKRKETLKHCVGKLSAGNQHLVRLRYTDGKSYREIADMVQRDANTLYVAFNRIHQALSQCVQRGVSAT